MSSHADWLADSARLVPEREALRAGKRSCSYRELDERASALADWLIARGVERNDRVATLLPNGFSAAVMPHAVLRAGAVLVPLNTRLSQTEIDWQLAHCKPAVLVTASDGSDPQAGELRISRYARPDENRAPKDVGIPRRDGRHPFAIIYTSGTTGRPKGAILTAENFRASAEASARNLGVRDDDRWLAVLPLFHVGGLSIVVRSAIYGTGAVIQERFDAAAANHAIDHEGITIVSLVSVLLQRLLDDRGDRPFPPTLRCALVGGGPVPRPLLQRCAHIAMPVVQTYGLTEATSQVATLAPEDALRKLGSAGRPLDGTEIRIGGDTEGEILVRGPTVMAGYLDDAEATAAVLRDGWLHTGDVGRMDEDGFLYVLDRRDDLIVSGGENIYPAEVEAVLLSHPDVEDAGVVGAPDPAWGQRVVATVCLRSGALTSPSELETHARSRLAGYKVPKDIRISHGPLPRTPSGKLVRSALREQLD